jgi:hypothetical protein
LSLSERKNAEDNVGEGLGQKNRIVEVVDGKVVLARLNCLFIRMRKNIVRSKGMNLFLLFLELDILALYAIDGTLPLQ